MAAKQARRAKRENTTTSHNENSGDLVKDGKQQINAELKKPEDSKPRRDDANHHRPDAAPPVSNEGVPQRSPVNLHGQKHADQINHSENQRRHSKTYASGYEGKPADTAGNNPPSERRPASEGATPGRIRTNHGDRVHRTPLHDDVTVPPFAEWDENDPSSGENYTGIFKTIADNRRTPGTPYQPPEPRNHNQESTGAKGCGCLSWFSKWHLSW